MKKIIIAILLSPGALHSMDNATSINEMLSALDKHSEAVGLGMSIRANEHKIRLLELEIKINSSESEAERLIHIKNKAKYEQEHDRLQTERLINSKRSWEVSDEARIAKIKSLSLQETQEAELERIRVGAQERGRAAAGINAQARIDVARIWVEKPLELIKNDPKLAVGVVAGAAAGIYAAKHGTALLTDAVRHYYRNPTLAQESSLLNPYEKAMAWVKSSKRSPYTLDDLILEESVLNRIKGFSNAIKITAQNQGYFSHTLLYGPPGTGKTLIAKTIADVSGLAYIYISGSSLRKFSVNEALIKLDELFNFAKNSSSPLVIIIDECEELFKKRETLQEHNDLIGLQLLNHILMHTGTETADFVIIGLTNRPEVLDAAFMSRCNAMIEIGTPNFEQRKDLLRLYTKKWLTKKEEPKPGFVASMFTWNKQPVKTLTMAPNVLSEDVVNDIALRIDHFTGRDISQLIIDIKMTAFCTSQGLITADIVEQSVVQKIEKKATEAKFA